MGTQDQAVGVQRRWIGWSPDLGLGRPTTDLGLPPTFASYKYLLTYWTINRPVELICKSVEKLRAIFHLRESYLHILVVRIVPGS